MPKENTIKSLKIKIRLLNKSKDVIHILDISTKPENLLAPDNLEIRSVEKERELIITITYKQKENKTLKINTIRRTVDDYIWSLNTVEKIIRIVDKGCSYEI